MGVGQLRRGLDQLKAGVPGPAGSVDGRSSVRDVLSSAWSNGNGGGSSSNGTGGDQGPESMQVHRQMSQEPSVGMHGSVHYKSSRCARRQPPHASAWAVQAVAQ